MRSLDRAVHPRKYVSRSQLGGFCKMHTSETDYFPEARKRYEEALSRPLEEATGGRLRFVGDEIVGSVCPPRRRDIQGGVNAR